MIRSMNDLVAHMRGAAMAAIVAIAIVACGGADHVGGDMRLAHGPEHVVRVALEAGATPESVAARLAGEVLLWRPESGFAVVAVHAHPPGLAPTERVEPSRDALATPAATEAGGIKIWSGGHKIWSGGDGVGAIAADNAAVWGQIRLDEARALAPAAGAGVRVAVIDTGLDLSHPAFAGALANSADWYDFVDEDRVPDEPRGAAAADAGFGHGTAVAALVLQVAPRATLLPLRVLDSDGVGDLAALLRAVDHAVEHGAQVLNVSLGAGEDSDALRAVIDHAASYGVFVVASAGNAGDDRVTFPAAIDDDLTVGVGSVDAEDVKSAFSTFGSHLTMVAPGEALWSAHPDGAAAYWSGTSMAAPLVSGAIALALAELTSQGEHGVSGDTSEVLYEALLEALVDVDELEANRAYGDDLGGRLDVAAFLRAAFDALRP
jgi:thermitase